MRYKRFKAHLHFIVNSCIEGKEYHFKCVKGLPEKAKYIRAGHDMNGDIWVIVEDESFPEVKSGAIIPELEIEFN